MSTTVRSSPERPDRPPFGVNLSGPLTGELGLGHAARLIARALEAVGVPFVMNNVVLPWHRSNDRSYHRFVRDNPFAINLCCLNPDALAPFVRSVSPAYWNPPGSRRYNIAVWNWETPDPPPAWREFYPLFDEFWVPSRYTAAAISKLGTAPVSVIPYAVNPPPIDLTAYPDAASAGLSADRFNFLYVFDFASTVIRKNPFALAWAFNLAFPPSCPDSDFPIPPALTFKVKNTAANVPAKLELLETLRPQRTYPGRAVLIDEDWDHGRILAAIRHCDAYVSPHRAEGFGVTIAEAMACDRPVVMCSYSGAGELAPDSCYFPVPHAIVPIERGEYLYDQGTAWADIRAEDLAARLRELIADPEAAAAVGRRAGQHVREKLRPAAIGRQIWEELTHRIYPTL